MSEKQESSVLFSLKELMNLEEDRIKQEDADRQARVDADRRAQEEAELRRRQDESARLAAEEERRRVEEQRQREEAARLDAIRHAEIEKKRIEAERAAQLEAMSKQQEHARQLAMIQQDQGKKKLRTTLVAVGIGAVLVIGGVTGVLIKNSNEATAKQAQLEKERAAQAEEAEKAKKEAAELNQKISTLMEQLSGARDEKSRLELQQKLAEAQDALKKKAVPGVGGPRPAGDTGAKPAGGGSKCPPGDPMCGL
jgi:colicin import membrane protein